MVCSAASAKLEVLAVNLQQAPAPKHDVFDKLPVEFWNMPMAAQPDTSQRLGFLQLDGDAVQALREIARS